MRVSPETDTTLSKDGFDSIHDAENLVEVAFDLEIHPRRMWPPGFVCGRQQRETGVLDELPGHAVEFGGYLHGELIELPDGTGLSGGDQTPNLTMMKTHTQINPNELHATIKLGIDADAK